MRTLRILALALLVCSNASACVDGSGEEASSDPEESEDPQPGDDLDPTFDDGLGALLESDPTAIAPPSDSEAPTPTTTPRCDATAKSGTYCAGDHVENGIKNTLYRCSGPNTDAKAVSVCASGCVIAPAGTADYCKASAPTCDATASSGDYCGGDKVSYASPNTLYHCTGPSVAATVVKVCASGCVVAPAGSDDYCKATTTSGSPSADACPHVSSILKWGLHPKASDRLRCVGITAARITQTIGSASASAGTHAQDGVYDGRAYSAATDLSVSGLTDSQVKTLLARLDAIGFAAFFRKPCYDGWPCSEARHIHVVFAGAYMKSSLRAQISDFLAGKNGLASHTTYNFYQPPAEVKAYVKKLFDAAN
jgi:hypothetical protein